MYFFKVINEFHFINQISLLLSYMTTLPESLVELVTVHRTMESYGPVTARQVPVLGYGDQP